MTVAAENSTVKPRTLVNSVILVPMVSMTLYPHVHIPTQIMNPPNASRDVGQWAFSATMPVE